MGGLGFLLRELGRKGHRLKVLGLLRAEAVYLLLWDHTDTCTGSWLTGAHQLPSRPECRVGRGCGWGAQVKVFPTEEMSVMGAGEKELAFITLKGPCPRRQLGREIGY